MAGGRKSILYRTPLECGHELLFEKNHIPNANDVAWCPRCQEYRKVPMLKEWQLKCSRCSYAPKFGSDVDAALLAQAKHSRHETTIVQVTRIERVA